MSKYFTRVFLQILDSSIADDFLVRHVFEDLFKLADWRTGVVDLTRVAISRRIGLPLAELNRCLKVLEDPDPNSRSKNEDGRRIKRIDQRRDWGWVIINWKEYNEQAQRLGNQDRVERHRERQKLSRGLTGGNVEDPPHVPRGKTPDDSQEDLGGPSENTPPANGVLCAVPAPQPDEFLEWAMMKRTGHTVTECRRLFDYLVENKWRDMNGEVLRDWRKCGWMLTADQYQRILCPPVPKGEGLYSKEPTLPAHWVLVSDKVFYKAQEVLCGGLQEDRGPHRVLIHKDTRQEFGMAKWRSDYECWMDPQYVPEIEKLLG